MVIGAGMVGVTTALQLQGSPQLKDFGANVLLVSKGQPEDGASFGNAGILQAEAVEPYAMPRDLATLARIALGRDNAVHFTIRGILPQLGALMRYWRASSPRHHQAASAVYSQLIGDVLSDHGRLIELSGAGHLVRKTGFLELHQTTAGFEQAAKTAERLAIRYGVKSEPLALGALRAKEPALHLDQGGAVHWTDPWSLSDPAQLVEAYRQAFLKAGGRQAEGDAAELEQLPSGNGWRITLKDGHGFETAEHVVLALGAATPEIAQRFGHRFPMVQKRGYHRYFGGGEGLTRPVVDHDHGFVLSPMAGGLRLHTGAAFVHDPNAPAPQLAKSQARAEVLLDQTLEPRSPQWTGVRPCMPDMLPVMGKSSKKRGLWFHFGHGHQGLTLGPTTARFLAGQILRRSNRDGDLDQALSPDRFD